MIEDPVLLAQAEALVARYAAAGRRIATAESCTGGLVAGLLTAVPGSSAVLERGFVTYSNAAKVSMLGVPEATLAAHGAVRGVGEAALRGAPLRISLTTEEGTVVAAGRGPEVAVIGAIGEVTMWAFGRDEALVTFEGADGDIDLLGSVVRSL